MRTQFEHISEQLQFVEEFLIFVILSNDTIKIEADLSNNTHNSKVNGFHFRKIRSVKCNPFR